MADDDKIAQFISITSSTPSEAQTFLAQANNDVEAAIGLFFAASDDPMDDPVPSDDEHDEEEETMTGGAAASPASASVRASGGGAGAGGNTLGGGKAEPLPEGWGRPSGGGTGARVGRVGQWGGSGAAPSSQGSGSGPRIATLGSIGGGGGASGPSPSRGGGGDDDDDDDDGEEWYAGGERSGINVENPDRAPPGQGRGIVKDILKKAKEAGPPPGSDPSSSSASSSSTGPSWGSGNTLGSDSAPSTSVPDPSKPPPRGDDEMDGGEDEEEDDEEVAIRHLTFWKDGFSIEDGELRRYDEPGNKMLLEAINLGRAPPSLMNVRPNQPVEVRVAKRLSEPYQPPPPKPKGPWEGSGNRLGAPTPSLSSSSAPSSSSSTNQPPGAFPNSSLTSPSPAASGNTAPRFSVDTSLPTTSLQIRLGDGTRLVAKVNLTHTVGDVRGFIDAARPPSTSSRSYALQTTFPNRDLADDTQTIEDAKLQNAVIVQRWT